MIETTGLANPGPLIQSVYMDTECYKRIRLDSVLAVVGKWMWDDSSEIFYCSVIQIEMRYYNWL